jgi:ATP-dependent Clp protease adaptor protein ClpS
MAEKRERSTAIATRTERQVKRPRQFRVLLHNDDYTTMDFVVEVLERYFDKPPAEANRIMLEVHFAGVGCAGIYPREVAETKVAQVADEAQRQEMPLLVTAEPE